MKNNFDFYKGFDSLLNKKESVFNTYFYSRKIGDNLANREVLDDLLDKENELNLIISHAGSGKTYEFMMNERQFVLFVPYVYQVKQVASEYSKKGIDVLGVSGGTNFQEVKDKMNENTKLVATIDLFKEVKEFFGIKKVVVDEAHKLVLDSDFRGCLRQIEENYDGLDIIYISATPDPLMYLHFDNVVAFEQYEKDVFPNSYRFIKIKSNFEKALLKVIKENKARGIKTLVRINSKKIAKNLIKELDKMNFTFGIINRDEKNIKFKDEETGEITYDNELTNYIINKSILPNYDVYFTTQICDQGINLEGIENGSLEELESIYCVFLKDDTVLDDIIQFESRIRNKYHKFNIMVVDREEVKEVKPLNSLVSNFHTVIEKTKENYDSLKSFYRETLGEEQALKELKNSLNYRALDKTIGTINSCMSIDDNFNISIDLKVFYTYVYSFYSNQFFYNTDELRPFISDNWEDDYIIDESEEEVEHITLSRKEQKEILSEVVRLKDICDNELSLNRERKELLNLLEDDFKSEMRDLERFLLVNKDNEEEQKRVKEEVFDIMATQSVKTIRETKEAILFNQLKEEFTINPVNFDEECEFISKVEELKKLLLEENFTYRIRLDKRNLLHYRIIQLPNIEKLLRELFLSEFDFVDLLNKVSSFEEIGFIISSKQYIDNNNRYLKGMKMLGGRAAEEQLFIIKTIGKFENKDKNYIDDEKIKNLKKKMDRHFSTKDTKADYKVEDIDKVLKKIFKIGANGRLNGLRIK